MKWSNEKTEQLKRLCFDGKSNQEIAEELGIPLTDVYAKRRQLGITIDRVKLLKGLVKKSEFKNFGTELENLNRKSQFIKTLFRTVKMADPNIHRLKLSDDGNKVIIGYINGYYKMVNIAFDSYLAIILNVVGSLR